MAKASKEETQFKLQCEVFDAAPAQNLTVMWYKNDDIIDIKSFSEETKKPVNISSIVMVNISRGENTVSLTCGARLNLGPQGPDFTVVSTTYNVSALCEYASCLRSHSPFFIFFFGFIDFTFMFEWIKTFLFCFFRCSWDTHKQKEWHHCF